MLRICCLLICSLYSSFYCRAEPLHVYCEDWPSFCTPASEGVYVDILRKIYEPHGYQIEIHIVAYKRALTQIKNKTGDIALGVYHGEVQGVLEGHYPDSADDVVVYMLKKWQPEWKGEESLRDQMVLWQKGWAYDKDITVPMIWRETDSYQQALKLIEKNRYRYYISVGALHLDEPPPEIAKVFWRWENTYPIFADTEQGGKLRKLWDTEMYRLIHQGTLADIYRRYQLHDYYRSFFKSLEQHPKKEGSNQSL